MQGRIEKIWENETKGGKTYWVLEIDGEKYSVWKPSYLEGIGEGDWVEYEFKESGDFRNITQLELCEPEEFGQAKARFSPETIRVTRATSLRYAIDLAATDQELDSQGKAEFVLETAPKFEQYILDELVGGSYERENKQDLDK
jgi:hypothetical protein